jgi:dTDP-4-amino-4,6-dideoxygalactose transaminase
MRAEFLPYCRPSIGVDDISAVTACLQNGWLTTGPISHSLEEAFVIKSRVKHGVAVNSCTAALHLALASLGIGPGDEVIMPALSFVAGAECVRHLGAEPVFCDIDPSTLSISIDTVAPVVSTRTKAVIAMQYGGTPIGIESLAAFARNKGMAVVEDAAHALGTLDDGQWPGFFSDAAAYSFYATKNITSGEGGILLTNRDDIAYRARILSLHGMDHNAWGRYTKGGNWRYDVVDCGYKYNFADLMASLALSQFHKVEVLQRRREEIANRYLTGLQNIHGIRALSRFAMPPNRNSWCLFPVAIDEEAIGLGRDQVVEELKRRNIGTSVHFIPTHLFAAYRGTRCGAMTTTESLWARILSLPLFPAMTNTDVDDVLEALADIVKRNS